MLAVDTTRSESAVYSSTLLVQAREPCLPKILVDDVSPATPTIQYTPADKVVLRSELFKLLAKILDV